MTEEPITEDIPEEEPAVPAEDHTISISQLYLQNYLPLMVGMVGDIKDPRVRVPLKLKAADIALSLTQMAVYRAGAGE